MLITCSKCRKTLFVSASGADAGERRTVCGGCGQELFVDSTGGVRAGAAPSDPPPATDASPPGAPAGVDPSWPAAGASAGPVTAGETPPAGESFAAAPESQLGPPIAQAQAPGESFAAAPESQLGPPVAQGPAPGESFGYPSPLFDPPSPSPRASVSPFGSGPLWPSSVPFASPAVPAVGPVDSAGQPPPAGRRDSESDAESEAIASAFDALTVDAPRPEPTAPTGPRAASLLGGIGLPRADSPRGEGGWPARPPARGGPPWPGSSALPGPRPATPPPPLRGAPPLPAATTPSPFAPGSSDAPPPLPAAPAPSPSAPGASGAPPPLPAAPPASGAPDVPPPLTGSPRQAAPEPPGRGPVLLSKRVADATPVPGAVLRLGDDEAPSIAYVSVGAATRTAPQAEVPPAQLWVPPLVAGMRSGAEPEAELLPRRRPTPVEDEEPLPVRSSRTRWLALLVLVAASVGAAWFLVTQRGAAAPAGERRAEAVGATDPGPASAAPEPEPEPEPEPARPSPPGREPSRAKPGSTSAPARDASPGGTRDRARPAPQRRHPATPPARGSQSHARAPGATPASAVAGSDYYASASSHLRERKVQLAIDELESGLARNPRDARSYRLLGMAYSLAGAEKKSVEAFERFVRLDPGHEDVPKVKAIIAEYRRKHPR